MGFYDQFDENTLLKDVFPKPAYDNSDEPMPWSNHPPTLQGLTLTFLILSWLFVCFRLYVRTRIVKSLGWDDLFVFLYLICGTIASSMLLVSIKYGTGQHMLYVTIWQINHYLQTFYVLNGTINMATTFIKLSLLFQFLRIFHKGSWPYRTSVFGIVFVSLWGLAYTILAWFPCKTISHFWILTVGSQCWGYASTDKPHFVGTFISHTVINIVLDLYITAIPFQLYFDPKITRRTRMGLMVLLFLGAIVNFLAVWRLQSIIAHQAGWYPTQDPTWYGALMTLLSVLEVNCASICASVPIFWPVLRPLLGNIFVTREVSVKHEFRRDIRKVDSKHDRTASETELNAHYHDAYVMEQVAPFREGSLHLERSAQSRVVGDSERDLGDPGWHRLHE